MNRLTRKTDGRDYCSYCHQVEFDNEVLERNDPLLYENPQEYYNAYPYQTSEVGNEEEILNKLGQCEDLEDELGISLLILFKALKDGICYKSPYNVIHHISPHHIQLCNPHQWSLHINDTSLIFEYLRLKDYKKYWALCREDLEDER